MTYEQNERTTIQRQQLRITALENQLTTAHTDLAQRDDKIADLERQILSACEFHLAEMDAATARLVRERDEARAVAREMALGDILWSDGEWEFDSCNFCSAHINYMDWKDHVRKHQDHTPDCPVSKVRAWDAPTAPPAEDAPGFSAAHNPDV